MLLHFPLEFCFCALICIPSGIYRGVSLLFLSGWPGVPAEWVLLYFKLYIVVISVILSHLL